VIGLLTVTSIGGRVRQRANFSATGVPSDAFTLRLVRRL